MPNEHQEFQTGPGTKSRVASNFSSKPEDPTRKDKSKKLDWVCNFIIIITIFHKTRSDH